MEQPPSAAPPPDVKDWTWVLSRPCDQCGYDAPSLDRSALAGLVRANAGGWRTVLGRGDVVGERPPVGPGEPPLWSALEYGCHVRDVYALAVERTTRMLKKRSASFPAWDQNDAAISGAYHRQEPDKVAYALAVNAGKFADLLDRVRQNQWEREGERSDGSRFSVESLARYLLHDTHHHLWDANAGFEAIADERRRLARAAKGEMNGQEGDGD